jgi:protease I
MKALILTGRMVQDEELIVPTAMLQASGYAVNIAADKAGEFTGFRGCKFTANTFFDAVLEDKDIIAQKYQVLIIPGGVKCMEHMRLYPGISSLIAQYHKQGGVIGCICSGAFLLISAGLCKGRKIATYPAWKEDVENAGATFVNDVVVDDRIVTAPHYNVAGKWMAEVLRVVKETPTEDDRKRGEWGIYG